MQTSSFLLLSFSLLVHAQDDIRQSGQSYWKDSGLAELTRALAAQKAVNEGVARNTILFIGDGMGPNTVTAARVFRRGETSRLSFERFPHIGLLKTYAVNALVPDSACTATALLSGVKSNFYTVGVDGGVPLGDCAEARKEEHQVSTLAQWAQREGKSTGVVTTTRVTHATPSSLYGHSPHRNWECDGWKPAAAAQCKDLARQMIEDEPGRSLKVIMGGGRQCLQAGAKDRPNDPLDETACKRNDSRDLLQEWKEDKIKRKASWKLLENAGDLRTLDWDTDYVLGVFSNSHMPYDDQRELTDAGSPSLADMVRGAIMVLRRNPKGFLLVVEGGMIDQAHHKGQVRRALEETVLLHEAVQVATDLTSEQDTLIVVTADHAHSLTINGVSKGRGDILGTTRPSLVNGVPFTTLSYMVGAPSNFPYKVVDGAVVRTNPQELDTSKPDYYPQGGVLADEVAHGGVDVTVYAQGPMAHLFHSVHEQSYVAHAMAYATSIGPFKDREAVTVAAGHALAPHMGLAMLLPLIPCLLYRQLVPT